tara:strand:- start:42400 stop:43413 length:1014 start_codon:yes stop_codon:yes gene_type:complete
MKLLILSTYPYKSINLKNCKKQYHIYLYFIDKYIKKNFPEIEVIYKTLGDTGRSSRIKDFYKKQSYPKCDHCLVVANRGIKRRPDEFWNKIRSVTKYCIATISANNSEVSREDVLFYQIPSGKSRKFKCRLINWCCEPLYCKPMQDKTKINILIDHPYYGYGRMKKIDQTLQISNIVWNWAKDKDNVVVRRFCKGGIEVVNEKNFDSLEKYEQNNGLSYDEACKVYNTTDIFFVTHAECMGLVVLECAMAGALIVSPEGFIKRELLRNVHHVKLDNDFSIDKMDHIINSIDHAKSRRKVLPFSWENGVNTIIDTFQNWNLYKSKLVWNNIHRSLKIK